MEGSSDGPDTGADTIWHQDVSGVVGSAEPGDRFGESLAVGDFDNDGFMDLAIGVPDEDFGSVESAGSAIMVSVHAWPIATAEKSFFAVAVRGVSGWWWRFPRSRWCDSPTDIPSRVPYSQACRV